MKITMEEILYRSALEKITGVSPKDAIVDGDLITFLVPNDLMGKVIGKGAVNIKALQDALHKRVEIVPYSDKPEEIFAKAIEVNIATSKINGTKLIVHVDGASKSKVFKNNSRIRRVKELISRNFNLDLIIN